MIYYYGRINYVPMGLNINRWNADHALVAAPVLVWERFVPTALSINKPNHKWIRIQTLTMVDRLRGTLDRPIVAVVPFPFYLFFVREWSIPSIGYGTSWISETKCSTYGRAPG